MEMHLRMKLYSEVPQVYDERTFTKCPTFPVFLFCLHLKKITLI